MTVKFDAKRLIELLSDAGVDVRKYSGRGMYGSQCVGFTTDENEYGIIADLVAGVDDEPERLQLANVFRGTRTDSLGLGTIIYFPRVEWPEGVSESDYRNDDDEDDDDYSEDDDDE